MFFRYSSTPAGVRIPANRLVEHNQYVYGEPLGMTPEKVAEMERESVIGTEYLSDV